MKPVSNLLILFFIILYQPASFGSVHTFSKLSVENGLSNNEVNAIYKDSQGFIWFGTLFGLDRFDGVEIRSYANKFPDQVENVLSIAEDSEKTLWVGTSEGLFCYKKNIDRFHKISLNKQIAINVIQSVGNNQLFIGTTDGLIILNTETEQSEYIKLDPDSSSRQNFIEDILVDSHGSCWLATHQGLLRISVDDREINNYYFESEFQEDYNSFTSLCAVGNKIYLGTTNAGIVEFNLNSKIFSKNNNLENYLVTTIASDDREKLYIGTNGSGLLIHNLRTGQVEIVEKVEDDPRSLSSNSIYSVLLDENQRFWIGTYSGGINYTNTVSGGFHLHPISTEYASVNKSVRSFYFSPDGNQYFGTRNGFIHRDRNEKITLFRDNSTNGELRSNIILTVFPFHDQILIGTYGGGVSIYDPAQKKISSFLNDERFRNSNNYSFVADNHGQLWIGSYNGVYQYRESDGRILNFNSENCSLNSSQIFYLTIDSKNRLWVGTNRGVSVFNIEGDSLKALELPEGVGNTYKINYIFEDQAGNMWVCTEIGGLYVFEDNLVSFEGYSQKDGLPDNSVCTIVENRPGSFWISTLKGFCHFTLENSLFKNYSISDGLPGLVFSPAAACLSEDGQLWFGNEKGLMGFYPENIVDQVINSQIVMTNMYISGQNVLPDPNSVLEKPIEHTEQLVLDYNSSSIGFRFVDLNYLSPYDNNYYTMLEGYDKEWKNNGNGNVVYYNQLKPGKYLFKVKNVVNAVEETEWITELNIVIKQPITRSIYFWIGLVFIVVAVSLYGYRKYVKLRKIQKEYIREHKEPQKYQSSGLNEKDLVRIIEKVKHYVKAEKAYLRADIKLSEISKELNIPSHHISQALNQVLNQGFSDFINKYRVREVRYMLENDVQQKLTLMAIAKQCGFNSKTSFFRVFKKFTGTTPTDYIEQLKS